MRKWSGSSCCGKLGAGLPCRCPVESCRPHAFQPCMAILLSCRIRAPDVPLPTHLATTPCFVHTVQECLHGSALRWP